MKRNRVMIVCLLILSLFTVSLPAGAKSLWNEEQGNLYRDRTAHEVGDLVTIIIYEESRASQQASTDTEQNMEIEAGPGLGIFNFITGFSAEYGDQSGAQGSTDRQGSLSAKVTVMITDEVSPGVFKLKGEKTIVVNGEEEIIVLTGLVREADISPQNTVDSVHLAQVEIDYKGKGAIDHKQKTSIFEWLLGWLF
ncbi:MAG: flagellar basal body L-ring protein FlgH [Halanaerobium sp.]|nr:flagellar basal body L-ring protein FlgH [Halanaerobium sp.]